MLSIDCGPLHEVPVPDLIGCPAISAWLLSVVQASKDVPNLMCEGEGVSRLGPAGGCRGRAVRGVVVVV